jgi:hypothetical protein
LSSQETIILLHGTYAKPKKNGPKQWYQPDSEFCRSMDEKLKALGSPARCWAHLPQSDTEAKVGESCTEMGYFHWGGENDWIDRTAAAFKLTGYMRNLIDKGWRIHVIAHSHGGNVLLEALDIAAQDFACYGDYEDGFLVTLGTPFLEDRGFSKNDGPKGISRTSFFVSSIVTISLAWIYWPKLSVELGRLFHPLLSKIPDYSTSVYFEPVFFICLSLLLIMTILLISMNTFWKLGEFIGRKCGLDNDPIAHLTFIKDRNSYSLRYKRMLVLSSSHDEAFLLLSKLAPSIPDIIKGDQADAPSFAEKLNSFGKWIAGVAAATKRIDDVRLYNPQRFSVLQSYLSLFAFIGLFIIFIIISSITLFITNHIGLNKIDSIAALILLTLVFTGICQYRIVVSFISAPARLFFVLKDVLQAIGGKLLQWLFRKYAGDYLRNMMFGLSGFPSNRKYNVKQEPVIGGNDFYEFRLLPQKVTTEVLRDRRTGTYSLTEYVERLLPNTDKSVAEMLSLLKKIATDVTLVHSAYYERDFCRQEIAKWIARDLVKLDKEAYQNQPF